MYYVKNILNIAKAKNVTDRQICEMLKKNPSYVSDWKSGKSKPKADEIIILADYFGVTTDYLLGRTNTASDLSPQEQQLVDAFRAVSRQGREYLLQQAVIAQEIYKNSNSVSNMETRIG